MSTFWRRVARLEEEGTPFVLCTVVQATGSVPRGPGAHMLVLADGSTEGSVGGAGAEEGVKHAALEALAHRQGPRLCTFDLWYRKEQGLDSLCGGSVTVYIEPMHQRTHVLILGGGHVALALTRLLEVLEYTFTVVDDRPEYSSAERFPGAAATHTEVAARFGAEQDLTPYTHVVLLGYSHGADQAALQTLLPRFRGYVGQVGSRTKAREFRQRLIAQGLPAEQVEAVRCPVGVEINAETAAEVALSIAAEIVQTTRQSPCSPSPGGETTPCA
jgi:xanthine dehydrogenase accessory factor